MLRQAKNITTTGVNSNVFVRFAGCNLTCVTSKHGFTCDTDYVKRHSMTATEVVRAVVSVARDTDCEWVAFTGGEPMLQLDQDLIDAFKKVGMHTALETNGTKCIDMVLDFVAVSPKRGESIVVDPHTVDEVRLVVGADLAPDAAQLAFAGLVKRAMGYTFLSPATQGYEFVPGAVSRCMDMVRKDSGFRISVQMHKMLGVR